LKYINGGGEKKEQGRSAFSCNIFGSRAVVPSLGISLEESSSAFSWNIFGSRVAVVSSLEIYI